MAYLICGNGGNPKNSRKEAERVHPSSWNSLTTKFGRDIWDSIAKEVLKRGEANTTVVSKN